MQKKIDKLLYYLLSIIFFLSSFRLENSESGEAKTYFAPFYISFIQKNSLYIVTILMVVSILLMPYKKIKFNFWNIPILYYFIFIILVIISGDSNISEMLLRLIFASITLVYFLMVVGKLDLKKLLLAIFLGLFGFTLLNFIAYYLIPTTIWNGRLFGMTSHPNFTGVSAAFSSIFSIYYIIKTRGKYKLISLLTLIIGVSVCLFTGSRNSFAMIIIAIATLIFYKLKNVENKLALLIFFFLSISVFLIFDVSVSDIDYEGRGNTRSGTWGTMFKTVLEFPIFGVGKTGPTTNSYLFAIVAAGFSGFVFFALSILKVIRKLKFANFKLEIEIINLFRMVMVSMLFSALFEGFFLDQMSTVIFIYWLLLVINLNKNKINEI
tara:strand:+ start:972 stop:2111 length:1140 start_codon:yes stop_codon:yes gene_type:complete